MCAATPVGRPTANQAVGALLTLGAYVGIAFAGPRLVGTNPQVLVVIVVACLVAVALGIAAGRSRSAGDPPRWASSRRLAWTLAAARARLGNDDRRAQVHPA